jgi:predicted nucleic acid-binding protein
MRYRVFLDTNILISGIFFEGNESRILNLSEVDLITCADCADELHRIVRKKFKHLGDRSLELALLELEKALSDIDVLQRPQYKAKLKAAEKLITHKKDISILAAAIAAGPDYLLTGDKHFFTSKTRKALNVKTSREFLSEISRAR